MIRFKYSFIDIIKSKNVKERFKITIIDTKQSSDEKIEKYSKYYHRIIRKLALRENIPVEFYPEFFKFCNSQKTENAHKYLDKEFKKRIKQKYQNKKNWKCNICGSTKELTLHHKKKKSEYPELRYDKNNIEILCDTCHKQLHLREENFERRRIKRIKETNRQDFQIKNTIELEYKDWTKVTSGEKIQETLLDDIDIEIGDLIKAYFTKNNDLKIEYLICSGKYKIKYGDI